MPLIEADVSLLDIKVLARWCERTATDYAGAAVLADRASRAPARAMNQRHVTGYAATPPRSFSYASAALAKENSND